MRECWNRQTGTFEVRVFRRVGSSPISRTSRKSLESKDSKLFSFYWFYNKCWGRGKPDPIFCEKLIKPAKMNHPHTPFTPHYIFKGIPESCSSVMSGIFAFTSSRFMFFLSACALLTRIASALAVQFYAMPGEFGYRNCPSRLHAARVGIKSSVEALL